MANDDKAAPPSKVDQTQLADEIRRFEIEHFWIRSLFFAGVMAAVFTGIQEVKGDKEDPIVVFTLWCFGFVCALAWSLANRGGKYWQETWEPHGLDHRGLVGQGVPGFEDSAKSAKSRKSVFSWDGTRYSPSRLAMAVSDGAVAMWAILAINWASEWVCRAKYIDVLIDNSYKWVGALVILSITVIWCIRMMIQGKGEHRRKLLVPEGSPDGK